MIASIVASAASKPKKGKTMKTLLILLVALVFGTQSGNAQALPPVPEGGLHTTQHGPCTDNVTGRHGICVIQMDVDGNSYVTLLIDGQVETIRQAVDGSYITLYQRGEHGL